MAILYNLLIHREVLYFWPLAMDQLIFTESGTHPDQLYPFSLTRQAQDLRVGILRIREKWERMLGMPSKDLVLPGDRPVNRSAERVVIPGSIDAGKVFLVVHGNVLPTVALVKAAKKLRPGHSIGDEHDRAVIWCLKGAALDAGELALANTAGIVFDGRIDLIRYPWDIIAFNDEAIRQDFQLITHGRKTRTIPRSNQVINPGQVFIEKGAIVEHATLNASQGPIYIGLDAEVMEGCMIRGPFALGESAALKMGAKVYGATSVGPWCIAAGEIKNTVMSAYSNKAHDGYLGDSVIGEWCNLGAGTTNSNLKNNAGIIRMWTPQGPVEAGRKCGVMMGDYSRTAINTSINTGTVIGASANVFSAGLTPKYIPSFAWGTQGELKYDFDRAMKDIDAWKQLKKRSLTMEEENVLRHVYEGDR